MASKTTITQKQIADEAADWAVLLDAGPLADKQQQELASWLLESPRHGEELLLASSIIAGLEKVDEGKTISIDDLLTQSAPDIVPITRTLHSPNMPQQRKNWKPAVIGLSALAASLMLYVGVAETSLYSQWQHLFSTEQPVYTTALGEQKSFTLADGSVVFLNTQSEIEVRYTGKERLINLTHGEAMFEVAPVAGRPFRVQTNDGVVEALGTKFNVYQKISGTSVAVVEGSVAVKSNSEERVVLDAGKQVNVQKEAGLSAVSEPNMQALTSWQIRKLMFTTERLDTIAAEFNRYNKVQIEVADATVAAIRFSGVFSADDPHSLLAFLEMDGNLRIDRSKESVIALHAKQK